MTEAPDARFELRQVSAREQIGIIRDHRHPAHDARGTIACVSQLDDGACDVTWLIDAALPARFASPADVLDALRRSASTDAESSAIPLALASEETVPTSFVG